jgi:membrane-bound ClpP family serine protease
MLVARFIGRIPVIVVSVLLAVVGVVLIVLGATASSGGTGKVIAGVVCIVGAALFVLDALSEPSARRT